MAEVLITGTGAMALLFGAKLAANGVKVSFLGTWEAGLHAIKKKGIRVAAPGRELNFPAKVYKDPADIKNPRLALVLVKSWQTERAAAQLAQILHPEGIALTLQNGLGNMEILARELGEERTAQGVTTYGATLLEPGLVRSGGDGLISLQKHPRLAPLMEVFHTAGFAVQQVPDLSSLIWGKITINVAINPLSALLGVSNGDLLRSEYTRKLMGQAASEAARVAASQEIQLAYPDPGLAAEAVAEATEKNISSMLQDINRGAPTEIDQLCGAVVEMGHRNGVDTPVNQLLWDLVKALVDLSKN
jgi:2-dehydropantoate 2-reductase